MPPKPRKKSKELPKATIPVYFLAEDEDFDKFLLSLEEGEDDSTPSIRGTQRFYRALRFGDAELSIPLWEGEP